MKTLIKQAIRQLLTISVLFMGGALFSSYDINDVSFKSRWVDCSDSDPKKWKFYDSNSPYAKTG